MFSCYPTTSLVLHECLFPENVTPAVASLVSKAQCLRNELCMQRENSEFGLARLYHDAIVECVRHVPPGGHARAHTVSKWCVGAPEWIVTLSGVRAEISLSLLASVYWCFSSKGPVAPAAFGHALESLRLLHECIATWANLPKQNPLPDFDVVHLNALRVYCHAALNIRACQEIEAGEAETDALTVKAQFARHAYEVLAPHTARLAKPRPRDLAPMIAALQREAIVECFVAAATLEKHKEAYEIALCILEKGKRLLGDGTGDRLDVLLRNVRDLQKVFSKEGGSVSRPASFEWSLIPCVECVLHKQSCAEHNEPLARKL